MPLHKAAVDEKWAIRSISAVMAPMAVMLSSAISLWEYDYKAHGIDIHPDEIFVSDGAKSDVQGNFQELFRKKVSWLLPTLFTQSMLIPMFFAGRAGGKGWWPLEQYSIFALHCRK